jgi:hypothetical protein
MVPVILATWGVNIGSSTFPRQPEQKSLVTPSQWNVVERTCQPSDNWKSKIVGLGKSQWWIADRPWDLDLHDFKQLFQIFMAARIG